MKPLLVLPFLLCVIARPDANREDYFRKRERLLALEDASYLGSDLALSLAERFANQHLMDLKRSELDAHFRNGTFPLAENFLKAKPEIDSSRVFEFIRQMPKGGALHLHEYSMVSTQWIVANVSYRDGLYMRAKDGWLTYGWFRNNASTLVHDGGVWQNVQAARAERGSAQVDGEILRSIQFTAEGYVAGDLNWVWRRFEKMIVAVSQMTNLASVFEDFMYQAYKEFMEDGVQYVEFRTLLGPVCNVTLDQGCQPLSGPELAELHWRVNRKFSGDHHGRWCGAKVIYSPHRGSSESDVSKDLDLQGRLMQGLPDFFIGFDLVGQEDLGKPLLDFVDILLKERTSPRIPYYFHAGETNWQGEATDLNLIDALLLGSRRIGHGYAIVKHPQAKLMAKERDVPLEICPISNQILDLVADLRNHPAASLIQDGQPLVISSDDPSPFGIKGLSYDLYAAFMALSGRNMDLRLLKKLVLNSIKYSEAGSECQAMVQQLWAQYMDRFLPKLTLA